MLGYDGLDGYLAERAIHRSVVVGRYANRICEGAILSEW